jgi:S-adenosyl-L-methionine hydrolase (adenosine-forming)
VHEGRRVKDYRSIITLTTDFGHHDPFAGIMKGVVAGINRDAVVIDLSHGVAPQNIREAAFILAMSTPYFPTGTVHVAVVDPGVGGDRRAIAIQAGECFLVGPDNGVLSWAFRDIRPAAIRQIIRSDYIGPTVSATFHGRDIFAPAAAHLSAGVPIDALGPAAEDPVLIDFPLPEASDGTIRGEVLYIDRFGNLMTNVCAQGVQGMREITLGGTRVGRLCASYGAGQPGEVIALVSSTGYLEIAVNLGSAAQLLGASVGDRVTVLL